MSIWKGIQTAYNIYKGWKGAKTVKQAAQSLFDLGGTPGQG